MDDYSLSPVFNIRGNVAYEGKTYNNYGVFKFSPNNFDLSNKNIKVLGINFIFDKELPSYVKGYFFVRQKRLKTILC